MAATPSPVLSVRNLSVAFDLPAGTATAVDGVSLDIASGETLGLVGESGSGKSVTALALMRLLRRPGRVSGGQALFTDASGTQVDVLTVPAGDMPRIRGRHIGFVFQEPMTALDPVQTVGNQIAETLRVHKLASGREARQRAIELLDAVKIPNAAARVDDYPHQLSGGMRQRVCIAIAIACRPSLLIADEPTTALDVTIQAEILDLLSEMQASLGLAMLLITHDLGVIARSAQRVAVMYAGRIVEQGIVRDVLRSPEHPYTRGLLASLPGAVRGAALTPIDGTVPSLGHFPAGCTFHPRCRDRFAPCDTQVPGITTLEGGRLVRCHLHETHGAR